MKELICNIFYFGERCGGLEGTDIQHGFYFMRGVVVMKELMLTISTLGGCGGLESIEF